MVLRRPDPRSNLAGETPLFALFKQAVQTGKLPPVCDAASVFRTMQQRAGTVSVPAAGTGTIGVVDPSSAAHQQATALAELSASMPIARRPKLVHAVCMFDAARYRSLPGKAPNPAVGPLRKLFDSYARLFSAGAQLSGLGKEALTYDMRAYARKTMAKGELLFLLRDIEVLPQLVSRNEVEWIFDRRTHPKRMPHVEIRARPGAGARAVATLASEGPSSREETPQAGRAASVLGTGRASIASSGVAGGERLEVPPSARGLAAAAAAAADSGSLAGLSGPAAAAAVDIAVARDPLVEELGWTLDDATVEDQLRQGDLDFRRFARLLVRIALFAFSKPSIALSGLGMPISTPGTRGRPQLHREHGDDSLKLPGEEEDLQLLAQPSDGLDPVSRRASSSARQALEALGLTPALASRRIHASPQAKVRRFLRHTRLVSPSYVTHLLATVARETDDLINAPGPPPSDMDRASYLPQQSSAVGSAKKAVAALHARRTRLANARGALLADGEGRLVDSQWRGGGAANTIGALAAGSGGRHAGSGSGGAVHGGATSPASHATGVDPAARGREPVPTGYSVAYGAGVGGGIADGNGRGVDAFNDGDDTSDSDGDDFGSFPGGSTNAKPWGGLGGPYPETGTSGTLQGRDSRGDDVTGTVAAVRSAMRRGQGSGTSRGVTFAGPKASAPGSGSVDLLAGSDSGPPDAITAAAAPLQASARMGIARTSIATRGFAVPDDGKGSGLAMLQSKRGRVVSEEEKDEEEARVGRGEQRPSGHVAGTAAAAREAAQRALVASGKLSAVWDTQPVGLRQSQTTSQSARALPPLHAQAGRSASGVAATASRRANPRLGQSRSSPALPSYLAGAPSDDSSIGRDSDVGTTSVSSRRRRGHSFQRARRNSPPVMTTAGGHSAGYVESALAGRLGQGNGRTGGGVGGVFELLSAGASVESRSVGGGDAAGRGHSAVPSSRSGRQAVQSAFHVGSTIVAAPLGGAAAADLLTVTAGNAEHALEMAGMWDADGVSRVHLAPVSDGLGNAPGGVRKGEWKGSRLETLSAAAEAEATTTRIRAMRSSGRRVRSPSSDLVGGHETTNTLDSALERAADRLSRVELVPVAAGGFAVGGIKGSGRAGGNGRGGGGRVGMGAAGGAWRRSLLSADSAQDTVLTRAAREGAASRMLRAASAEPSGTDSGSLASLGDTASLAGSVAQTAGPGRAGMPLGPEHACRISYDPRLLGLLTGISQDPNARRWTAYAPAVGEAFMDFGRVLVGKTYGYRLELRNTSGDTLRVQAGKSGLPGLRMRYKARPVAAGMTILVDLQLRAPQASETVGHIVVNAQCGNGRSERVAVPCYMRTVLPGSVAARLADLPPAVGVVPLGVDERADDRSDSDDGDLLSHAEAAGRTSPHQLDAASDADQGRAGSRRGGSAVLSARGSPGLPPHALGSVAQGRDLPSAAPPRSPGGRASLVRVGSWTSLESGGRSRSETT